MSDGCAERSDQHGKLEAAGQQNPQHSAASAT